MIKVLLSAYNGGAYIKEQLDSIIAQDTDVEILVRDDGSSDNTREILNAYAADGKINWYSGDNLGCAKSFWQLMKDAGDADYYAFCDQDDVWDTDKLSAAVDMLKMRDNSKPLLYMGTVRVVDQNLKIISDQGAANNFKGTFGEALISSAAPGCTFVFNRAAREILARYDGNGIDIHDWMAHKIIAAFGEIVIDSVPHMAYRQHGNNVIGAERRGLKAKWKKIKRFINGSSTNVRLKAAKIIKANYYDSLSKANQKILDDLVNYKNGFAAKLKLLRNKNISTTSKMTNFKLKLLILLGKI